MHTVFDLFSAYALISTQSVLFWVIKNHSNKCTYFCQWHASFHYVSKQLPDGTFQSERSTFTCFNINSFMFSLQTGVFISLFFSLKRHLWNPNSTLSQMCACYGEILRPNLGPYWFIIAKYDVHTSTSLQDIRQITGPWNIGHADLHFMTHKSMSQGWAMSDQLSA